MKQFKFKSLKIKSIYAERLLALIFIIIILLEAQLLYSKVYKILGTEPDMVPAGNVVRVDLSDYNQTLQLLDQLKSFVPKPWGLVDPNPFQ
ncbi:MAG: hypothetical protein A3B10_03865 [Candidatus Doudnabacteria bacterium RIFCSPLOWO2_01_FULL_44_21]|uniref:Uncharacterized protein n=1 Tax=Candidatus Doudnabacteria bacterium RIFCSPLOWO2_01_FULL_44_21 TaxID=1817841 RepID=A0A1F5PYG8_9BACT|nr:MAG: hypothetical protein A3B95_01980 [Candidatus Doudnabacteria bacterium RIFCSPHIGHO2_02_FULL_43_13b]OGE94894.1 MAG: hypothetical protein A3B10_03865 [Candidatus Doudnabacteria bacterium RIFCSPLOWO2_01_FULL_44_21]